MSSRKVFREEKSIHSVSSRKSTGGNIMRHVKTILTKSKKKQTHGSSIFGSSECLELDTQFTKDQGELDDYLTCFGLEDLIPVMDDLDITSLKELGECSLEEVRTAANDQNPGKVLTAHDTRVLTQKNIQRFRDNMIAEMQLMLGTNIDHAGGHLIFLSHFKLEAGTEAALMRSELEQIIVEEQEHPGNKFNVPIFLDSEDLTTLEDLKKAVKCSHNVVLLLTTGVLTRPWCLVEIVTAIQMNIPVIPVQLDKRGNNFSYPDAEFFKDLMENKTVLDEGAIELLQSCGIGLELAESCIKQVFKRIAVSYSPHKPGNIRRAELHELLNLCQVLAGGHA